MSDLRGPFLWRADLDRREAIRVECPDGVGGDDADGKHVYEKSHFSAEEDAWNAILLDANAWVRIAGRNLGHAQDAVLKNQAECGEACLNHDEVLRNRQARLDEIAAKEDES